MYWDLLRRGRLFGPAEGSRLGARGPSSPLRPPSAVLWLPTRLLRQPVSHKPVPQGGPLPNFGNRVSLPIFLLPAPGTRGAVMWPRGRGRTSREPFPTSHRRGGQEGTVPI